MTSAQSLTDVKEPPRVQGLTGSEVAQRIQQGKVNTLPPRSGRSALDIVRANVFTRVNALLGVLFVLVMGQAHPRFARRRRRGPPHGPSKRERDPD